MKKRSIFLFALSIALILATSMGSTMAYFTTYVTASGGYVLRLNSIPDRPGDETEIEEQFEDWTKHVRITSSDEARPMYVRVRAYAGSQFLLTYEGNNWEMGWIYKNGQPVKPDGYYYYKHILNGGERTTELDIHITFNEELGIANDDHFDVIVIYETVPVQYDDSGNPFANWDLVADGGVDR